VLFALLLAVVRRERRWLLLAAAALVWLLVETAFALHGWSGNRRFLFAPAAIAVILAGAGVGRLLTLAPRRSSPLFWAALAAVVALVVAIAPHMRTRVQVAHTSVTLVRNWARQIKRLETVVAKLGGPKPILACGQAVTEVSYQSILAWELGENVIDVGWEPDVWIKSGKPIVLFEPVGAGWQVRPTHIAASRRVACRRLATTTATT
jgi:asparagine N-glycosylation enzyme membrane subunit Stt3